MSFWYFFPVPDLPPEVAHQSNTVEIRRYLLKEGEQIRPGTPIALIENYWAIMQIEANGNGLLRKIFFDDGSTVNCGDPIARILCDGDDLVYEKPASTLKIVTMKRDKLRR